MDDKFDRVAIALNDTEYVILETDVIIDFGQGQGPRGGVISVKDGWLTVQGNEGTVRIASGSEGPGGAFPAHIRILGASGERLATAEGRIFRLYGLTGAESAIELDGTTASIVLRDSGDRSVIKMDGNNANLRVGAEGNEGDIVVRDSDGRNAIHIDGESASLRIGIESHGGDLKVRDSFGREVLRFFSAPASLLIGAEGKPGALIVKDTNGRDFFQVNPVMGQVEIGADSTGGILIVKNTLDGKETIRLDGDSGDIILSNADCAEEFDVMDFASAEPGTVLVIDDEERLAPSCVAYDRRVAGVVSGGGTYRPGIVLNRRNREARRPAVALMGKVFCKVDATDEPIAVGDLLVSSATPGHAMAARDPTRTPGAVLGKALRGMSQGRGLIPILVSLQ